MAPGAAGNVYAFDLRFHDGRMVGDLDEVEPNNDAAESPVLIRWNTVSTQANACTLLDGVAQVELPAGYSKLPRQPDVLIDPTDGGYFWDHALRGHASALILVLPPAHTLSRDVAPPIFCDSPCAARLSAKMFRDRIALLFIIEPEVYNPKSKWYMAPIQGSAGAEVARLNDLPPASNRRPQHMLVDAPLDQVQRQAELVKPEQPPPPAPPRWYKTRRFRAAVAIAAAIVLLFLFYGHKCPRLAVPQSHYVRQWNKPKVIVFVHGVLGDMDNTWTNSQAHTSWPELVASDPDLTDYDIYVYGYQSSCEGDQSNITEIANRFQANLIDGGFFSNYQEIYFIAHSMGGLITKRLLSSMNSDMDKLQRVRGVLLMAVPSAGAPIASLAGWLSTNPQFKNMDPQSSHAYLQIMEQDWNNMLRNRTPDSPFPRVFVAYETKDIAGMRIVPELFTSQVADATPIAFDYDHAAIVKPDSLTNQVYAWSKSRILESSKFPTTSADNRWFAISPPHNETFVAIVREVEMQKNISITFGSTCTSEQRNAIVRSNGAQLSGDDVADFLQNAVRPRVSVDFVVSTRNEDVSYEIDCKRANPAHALLRDAPRPASPNGAASR